MSDFKYIEIENYDTDLNGYEVLGWRTDDDQEEPTSLAVITVKGTVEYRQGFSAETLPDDVCKQIDTHIGNRVFSSSETLTDDLVKVLRCNSRNLSLTVWHPDGYTTYGVEIHDVLDNRYMFAGLLGSDCEPFKVKLEDSYVKDANATQLEEVAEWLAYDITTAVGEDWVIETD